MASGPRAPAALGMAIVLGTAVLDSTAAQEISLNYETLSSMEEPIAMEVGDVTFFLKGLVDSSVTFESIRDGKTDTGLVGNFEAGALTQMPNRWRVGVTYFGQYAAGEALDSEPDDRYEDNLAASVGGVWGTLLGGNVSGVVREQTRRLRGAGNASLAFDDGFGMLSDWGAGYVGRFGPWVASAVVDEDGSLDFGAMMQRPAGDKDVRLTLRTTGGSWTAADGSRRFDSRAGGVVGELIYGSTTFDAGMGLERLTSNRRDANRWYVSSGVRTKSGMLSLSLEGHYGRFEGEDEVSVALGLRYDLARGLSANLGLNHARASLALDGARIVDTDETRVVASLRYSF